MHLRLLRSAAAMFFLLLFVAFQNGHAQFSIRPYVQNTATNKAVVIWYTSSSQPGFLRYGREMGQWLDTLPTPSGTRHRVEITNLNPNTKYFYEVGSGNAVHATGELYFFRTHPKPGARVPFRFFAFGDFGDGSDTQMATAAQLIKQDRRHQFALLLGDIIYSSGSRDKYLSDYFPVYQDLIRHSAWWPTLGNHDIKSNGGAAYFEFFETPANNPRKIENYYSFDYANAHIVSLDDELHFSGNDLQQQLDWVKKDLADAKNRGQQWLIAMWHKPPYSAGTHGDDEDIQKYFVPIMDEHGVDLVLCGHSHVAERSFLLNNNRIVNKDLNSYPKDGFKPGTIYVVSGAGGKTGSVDPHPLMGFQLGDVTGFESIYINGDSLIGEWMNDKGERKDRFTMIKSGSGRPTLVQVADEAITPGQFAMHYPNPFHASAPGAGLHLRFSITSPAPVHAAIYDMLGRELARLSNGEIHAAGEHELRWNGRDETGRVAARGVYFYRVQAGNRVHSAKVLVLP